MGRCFPATPLLIYVIDSMLALPSANPQSTTLEIKKISHIHRNHPMESIFSISALLISLASLVISIRSHLQDHGRIHAFSTFHEGQDEKYDPPILSISIINRGRRPVILRLLGGDIKPTGWSGTYYNYSKGGNRLGEGERHDQQLGMEDLVSNDSEGNFNNFIDLWVEDTLGRRVKIKDARENIEKFWENWRILRKVS